MKRIVFLADTHCGHRSGLTPPGYWFPLSGGTEERRAWAKLQREAWSSYKRLKQEVGEPDILVGVGDLIDGSGFINNETELITTDKFTQSKMAVEALELWNAKRYIIVRGTPNHTGKHEDFEDLIATELNATVRDHAYMRVEGVTFDICHHIRVASDLKTRGTPLSRERIENLLRWERGDAPKAHIIIRAHSHMFCNIGGHNWEALTLPSLQLGSKFGTRRVRLICDWGIVYFDVHQGGYTWQKRIRQVKQQTEPEIIIP